MEAVYILLHYDRIRWTRYFTNLFTSSPRMPSELTDWCIVGLKIEKLARQKRNRKLLFFIYVHFPKTGVKIFHKTVPIRGIEFPLKYHREGSSLASGFLYLLIHGSSLSHFAQEQEARERERCLYLSAWGRLSSDRCVKQSVTCQHYREMKARVGTEAVCLWAWPIHHTHTHTPVLIHHQRHTLSVRVHLCRSKAAWGYPRIPRDEDREYCVLLNLSSSCSISLFPPQHTDQNLHPIILTLSEKARQN